MYAIVIRFGCYFGPGCETCELVSAVESEFLPRCIDSVGNPLNWEETALDVQCSLNFADRLLFTDLSQKTGVEKEYCGGK